MAVQQNPVLATKAKLFRGLADPSRLAIVEALCAGEKMVTEIVTLTGLSQPNVSGHLACLTDCGLLISRQEGRRVYYALADARMGVLLSAAEGMLSGTANRVSSCSNYECQTAHKCVSARRCGSTATRTAVLPSTRRGVMRVIVPEPQS